MNKRDVLIVIGIVIVVSVVISVLASSITGGVIKVKSESGNSKRNVEVYTKAEVDAKLNNLGGTPKNCLAHSFTASVSKNGTAICKEHTRNNCLIGEVTLTVINTSISNLVAVESRFIKCSDNFEDFDEDDELQDIAGLSVQTQFEVICCD